MQEFVYFLPHNLFTVLCKVNKCANKPTFLVFVYFGFNIPLNLNKNNEIMNDRIKLV